MAEYVYGLPWCDSSDMSLCPHQSVVNTRVTSIADVSLNAQYSLKHLHHACVNYFYLEYLC